MGVGLDDLDHVEREGHVPLAPRRHAHTRSNWDSPAVRFPTSVAESPAVIPLHGVSKGSAHDHFTEGLAVHFGKNSTTVTGLSVQQWRKMASTSQQLTLSLNHPPWIVDYGSGMETPANVFPHSLKLVLLRGASSPRRDFNAKHILALCEKTRTIFSATSV